MFDRKTEMESSTNGASTYFNAKFNELQKQKLQLEQEENELAQHRKQVQSEKDRIHKQLKRLDKKQELSKQEEIVRKQRMILEIQKRKYREDIDELDKLKDMLEKRKQETNTGFSELAESNKDIKSLKSGSNLGGRGFSISRHSKHAVDENNVIKEDELHQETSISHQELMIHSNPHTA